MLRKIIAGPAVIAASITLAALGPQIHAPSAAAATCQNAEYTADGHTSLRAFIRAYHPHGGFPGVLATEYTCAGGWDRDWSAYLRTVNRKGTGADMPLGMVVRYVGAGPKS